jgi:hypothetical protein
MRPRLVSACGFRGGYKKVRSGGPLGVDRSTFVTAVKGSIVTNQEYTH